MIRQMTNNDFNVVSKWFEARGVNNTDFLPKTHGYIVNDACAFFVYTVSNAPICFVEWIISDPALSAKESVRHLKELANHVEEVAEEAKAYGVTTFMILSNEKLCKLFKKFNVGCRGETSLVYGEA